MAGQMIRLAALVATIAVAGGAQALPSLSLVDKGGGLSWYVYLTIDGDGLTSIQWNISSDVSSVVLGDASGFVVLRSDPACVIVGFGQDCNIHASGPVTNPGNPNGLNDFAVFARSSGDVLVGAPLMATTGFLGENPQPIYVGYITYSTPANAFIPLTSVSGIDGFGNTFVLPEPSTAALTALGLVGLALRRRVQH